MTCLLTPTNVALPLASGLHRCSSSSRQVGSGVTLPEWGGFRRPLLPLLNGSFGIGPLTPQECEFSWELTVDKLSPGPHKAAMVGFLSPIGFVGGVSLWRYADKFASPTFISSS
jgi:hypothetical protein